MKRAAVTLGGVVAVLLLAAWWMLVPATSAGPCVVVHGPAMLPDIPESSGLAVSRRVPGLLWSHNDSGNAAVLFALDATGAIRGRVRVPVRTRDWEDISAAPCPSGDCLYIGDIGDNGESRRDIRIYRVPEPLPDAAETAAPAQFDGTYADGPHNAEGLFLIGGDLFIVTRDRVGGVYRASIDPGSPILRFRRIGELGLTVVTDAETSRDGRLVAVRTSREVVLYRAADVARGVFEPVGRIPIGGLREVLGEGVALDGDMLYLSSEGVPWNHDGRLVTLRCDSGPLSLLQLVDALFRRG